MRKVLAFIILSILSSSVMAQNIFNCSSGFAATGSCGIVQGGGQAFRMQGVSVGPVLSGSQVSLIPSGSTHVSAGMFYNTAVNVQAFTATATFVPNGSNVSFVINNANNNSGYNGPEFVGGAGCEASFYQRYGGGNIQPNNVFALEFDSYSYLSGSGPFAYSSAQIYPMGIIPCNPNDSDPYYFITNKFSTSPVPLNNPATSQGTASTDTFSMTVGYDGSNFSLCLYDVTAANGSCSSSTSGTGTYYQHTWTGVSVPQWVDGTTGYVGFMGATGVTSTTPLLINTFSYTVNTPTASFAFGINPYAGNAVVTSNPTVSPVAGTYNGGQTVTISGCSAGYSCCYTVATSQPSVLPGVSNQGNSGAQACISGTNYTAPVSISSTPGTYHLYVQAGCDPWCGQPSATMDNAYIITGAATGGSGLTPGAYISSGTIH